MSYLFCLETGGADQPGWLWCGTIPGALFLSKDHGEFVGAQRAAVGPAAAQGLDGRRVRRRRRRLDLRRSAPVGPSDHRRLHRRRLDQRRRRRILARLGRGMYADYFPPERRHDPEVQDMHRLVQCPPRPTRCGCSTTTACSARPTRRAPGRRSPRSARRSSASRWRCIRAIRTPRGSCPA